MDEVFLLQALAAADGFQNGYTECLLDCIQALVRNAGCSFSEACDLLDVLEHGRSDLVLDALSESLE